MPGVSVFLEDGIHFVSRRRNRTLLKDINGRILGIMRRKDFKFKDCGMRRWPPVTPISK